MMKLKRDLADYSKLCSKMFKWPENKKDWAKYRLSQEQVNFFQENGYLANIKLLEEEQVEQLREELLVVMDAKHPKHDLLYEFHSNESEDPDRVIFHSLGHWRMTPGFHDILWNPAYVMAAYQLLGNKGVRFWHDQLFCKPAKHGGVVAWHQDYSYWTRTSPMQHLTTWVGLDDASQENGCLQYIPGSQKWGLLDKPSLTGEMKGLTQFINDEQAKALENPIPVEMPKGYGSFHHPLLVHGSFENNSDRPRRAFVINVFADGTLSNTNEAILVGVPPIENGKKMEGKFFPMLFNGKIES
ncbi:phytanoyl-CoA dioxygenase family protein [uncultured Draconibacterium sp.]|uniref:phytanoyl-CoA dioxygenase family protein n=1 Tax=uncultured Draconibacterium sp. TaxID=1573823 RepID=UPI0025FEB6E9|nr:phytanoyl-CoA dioxygenase family protein [uncultured Draconibacterium sp.]